MSYKSSAPDFSSPSPCHHTKNVPYVELSTLNQRDYMRGFATFHPAVTFGFFVGAIVASVLVNQPLLQLVGLLMAAAYYLCIRRRAGLKTILGLIPVLIVLAAINPLFNTQGQTVLFTWLGGRPYTVEALVYGASMGIMFVSVLLWFFSYNQVVTSDKLTYLFGGFAPALTLVFTMVLRLVPTYQQKASDIARARACIGHDVSRGSLRERAQSGTTLLSALMSWALEGSAITADSMRSRGYGYGRRTSFASHAFTVRDILIAIVLCILFALALAATVTGHLTLDYFPVITAPPVAPLGVAGSLAFAIFLGTPVIIDLLEAASWRNSISRI